MAEVNGIKELQVKGETIEARGSFKFAQQADAYKKKQEVDGRQQETDGITVIFGEILERKMSGLAKFWHCASAVKFKNKFTLEDIEDALDQKINDEDVRPIEFFKGAAEVMNESRWFEEEVGNFWLMLNRSKKFSKAEDKEQAESYVEMTVENYKEITGKEPYKRTNKK